MGLIDWTPDAEFGPSIQGAEEFNE